MKESVYLLTLISLVSVSGLWLPEGDGEFGWLCKTMASKRKKCRFNYDPESIECRLFEKKTKLSQISEALASLKEINTAENLDLDEASALSILVSKLSFEEVLCLKVAINHVPSCYSMVPKGSTISYRLIFVKKILETKGIYYSIENLQHYVDYLTTYCGSFINSKIGSSATELFDLTNTTFNRFLSPPVSTCFMCGSTLKMHNSPTKAIVYSLEGPLPSTKVTLQCRECDIKFGISQYLDSEGFHFYSKEHKITEIVEASHVTYMDSKLYKWIPSLG